jgi:hypothetical protein
MRIQKKRVRNLQANLPGIEVGTELVLVVPMLEIEKSRLQQIGFTEDPEMGSTILPAIVGPVSRFNAEGSFIRHRDQPKETCYRQHQWQYKQWHGKDTVDMVEFVDVPYKRYPRTLVPPPGVELTVIVLPDGKQALAAVGSIVLDLENPDRLRHAINLMLEIFGFCTVVDKDLLPIGVVPTISLNWQVLPEGEMPWSALQPHVKKVLDIQKKGVRPVVAHRLEIINQYKPRFVAVGHGGFTGYVVFGFPDLGCYVLECARYGNATYVFENNWKDLSKLTKAQILNNNRHKARFIHLSHWEGCISSLLQGKMAA